MPPWGKLYLGCRRTLPPIQAPLLAAAAPAQEKPCVIIDQDAAGPGATGMMSILVLLQSPSVEPLGITVGWAMRGAMRKSRTRCGCSNGWGAPTSRLSPAGRFRWCGHSSPAGFGSNSSAKSRTKAHGRAPIAGTIPFRFPR